MAELAREGVAFKSAASALAPTEIAECFCNLEQELLDSDRGIVADRTSGRRKNSGRVGVSTSMLLHLSPKQLLVARKPTLMDDLITRNKTALLLNKMERSRVSKSKRSEVDSDPEPLAVKRLRTSEPIKTGKTRKLQEDRKMRVTTRRFMSSLRSGKKRSHIKEASLLERKKRTLKTSGTRSNDSETDTPSSNSSSKTNGHLLDRPVQKNVEKIEKRIVRRSPEVQDKPVSDSKIPKVKKDKSEPPTKKIRKKRRKVDSMIWLKKSRQKSQAETKLPTDVVIKTEPLLSQSEPEDSGLGSEMKLDLSKNDDKPSLSENVFDGSNKTETGDSENTCVDVLSNCRKPVWTIESFQVSPFKEPPGSEKDGSLVDGNETSQCKTEVVPSVAPVSPVSKTISNEDDDVVENETDCTNVSEIQLEVESLEETILKPVENELVESTAHDEVQNVIDAPSVVSDSSNSMEMPNIVDSVDDEARVLSDAVEINVDPEKDVNVSACPSLDPIENDSPSSESAQERNDDISVTSDDKSKPEVLRESVVGESLCVISSTEVQDLIVATTPDESVDELKVNGTPLESNIPDDKSMLTEDNITEQSTAVVIESEELPSEDLDMNIECDSGQLDSCQISSSTSQESVEGSETVEPLELDIVESKLEDTDKTLSNDLPEVNGVKEMSLTEEISCENEVSGNGDLKGINGNEVMESDDPKENAKSEEGVEQQALKADWLKALGLQSLRPMPDPLPTSSPPNKDLKEEKPSKVSEPGYTGTLKAVIKLNKGAPRSIVFKNNEETKSENPVTNEAAPSSGIVSPVSEPGNNRKSKEGVPVENDPVNSTTCTSVAPQTYVAESDEDKNLAKESNLIIPEKSSSFSIHPGRLCCDVCCYCFGKFGSLDTPCHIAQLKGEERQQKILQNEPYLTLDSCLCDACYRYVDRKANCPSSAAAKTAKRARPPAATLCCVTECTQTATHSVKRKWLLKIKRSLANKFEIDTEKHTAVFNPLCSNHHYWVDYYMVCGICRKRLNRNHLYTLGPETDRLNLVLAEDGIPARLSDKLFLCKLCRYYANMRLKYSDPTTIPPSSQPFYVNYRKKILSSLDVPVSDSDEDKPAKPKDGKDEDVMSLSGLATLLSDQPEPNQQPRIQVKFGNVNIGTLSNLNIGQGRQEERSSYDRSDPSNLPLSATFDFQGPSTSDGSWEKVTSTLQFDKKTKQLWQDLQRPYGNQSSFLRHLVMLEKYWRSGYLVLSDIADTRAAKYINSVQTRNKSFEGKTEVKAIKVEPPSEVAKTPPLPEPILKVPDPSRRFTEETPKVTPPTPEPPKITPQGGFLMPTGEVEVLPVNPNTRNIPKEKPVSKGTVIIQRPSTSHPPPSQSPCKIMITSVQSLAKPKVDPILLHRAKSLVRMVSPGLSVINRQPRPSLPTPTQRFPSRMMRPRQSLQFMPQPYQTLQAQLQAPPGNSPLQSLHQVVINRYPPPPLVKINQQMNSHQQQRLSTPRSLPSSVILQQQPQSAVTLLHQLQQPAVSIQQPHSVGLLSQHQQPTAVTLVQQPSLSLLQQQQQQPTISFIQQPQSTVSMHIQNQHSANVLQQLQQVSASTHQVKALPPPPYSMRPLLPKLPPSLSISTTPQSTTPNLPPSVSLLPPTSTGAVSSASAPLPPLSTLTNSSHSQKTPPPYSSTHSLTTPSVSIVPATSQAPSSVTLPSSITLPSSGITIEKQPHNFSTPPVLPPEKPIISVFREPLPTQDT